MSVAIVVNGACGRMGREIVSVAFSDKRCRVIGCIEHANHDAIGRDMGEIVGVGTKGVTCTTSLPQFHEPFVIIDFSTIESTRNLIESVRGQPIGYICGTTGLTDADMDLLTFCSKTNPILWSPNMSIGVSFLFYLTTIAAEFLTNDFDAEIIETHHRFKKDSPSGTAKKLAEIIAAAKKTTYENAARHGRHGLSSQREKSEIGIHAVRGGDIVGDHTVLFAGRGEHIELRHSAHSRTTFVQGAIQAALWIHDKKPRLYSMNDIFLHENKSGQA